VKTVRALKKRHGDRHLAGRAPPKAEETDLGQWWVPEVVVIGMQRGHPQCPSCTAKEQGKDKFVS
jgi:hypothetical protein